MQNHENEDSATSLTDDPDRLITFKQLRNLLPISRMTAWRMERRGEFPSRRQISENRVAWISEEVEEWLRSRTKVVTGSTWRASP